MINADDLFKPDFLKNKRKFYGNGSMEKIMEPFPYFITVFIQYDTRAAWENYK